MFEIEQQPTFPGSIKIKSLGRTQTMECVFRAKTRDEYSEIVKKKNGIDAFLALVESWNANITLDKAGLEKLEQNQPGVCWVVVSHYGEQLLAVREEN